MTGPKLPTGAGKYELVQDAKADLKAFRELIDSLPPPLITTAIYVATTGSDAALGKVIGPSFASAEMPDVVENLVATYLELRHEDERFVDTVHRVGIAPFKGRVYREDIEHAA